MLQRLRVPQVTLAASRPFWPCFRQYHNSHCANILPSSDRHAPLPVTAPAAAPSSQAMSAPTLIPPAADAGRTVVRGACPHDCPDTCAMLVTVEQGRAVRVQGDPEHPFTQGFLCAKVNRYLERTYHPDRLLHPMRRVGRKGEGRFERVSWEEAIDEIATRLRGVIDQHGPQAILPYSYAGTMGYLQGQSMDRRFFHTLGASRLARTICAEAGAVAMRMTLGANLGADAEGLPQSDLVILWGTNTLTSNPHMWPYVLEARANGATIICIDPIRTRTAEQCDEWYAIRPGTDAALALAMMHVLFAEGLEDRDYLERYTLGHAELRTRVAEWTPERAARRGRACSGRGSRGPRGPRRRGRASSRARAPRRCPDGWRATRRTARRCGCGSGRCR